MKSLYEEAKEADLIIGNHYSDLYLVDTPEARSLCKKHGAYVERFKRNNGPGYGLDIPFGYMPYWEKVMDKAQERTA